MSKSEIRIPPWLTAVNRLPAHQGILFPAVYIPACGGTVPPCRAVCVPFWNAIYSGFLSTVAKPWQKSADNTGLLLPDRNLKKFPLAIVEHVFYYNNTSYDRGKGGQERMQADKLSAKVNSGGNSKFRMS